MKTLQQLSLKSLIIFMMMFWGSGFAFGQNTPVAKNGQLRVVGTKLVNQYGHPIQLRGMSTHGIQWYGWGKCLTAGSLDALAYDWGADILRVSMYVQEGGYESNPTGFTNQVHTLIEEATKRGMYVLVDFHQLTPGDPNYNLNNARTFFTDIATRHKDKVNVLYDICNEPNGVAWSRIKTYADQLIPVIRGIDDDGVILIGTHGWASLGVSDGRTAQDIISNPVNFPNIMYAFHFYAKSHQSTYLNQLDWASDRLPIFVTEFGTQEASGDGPNDFVMSQRYIDLMRTKKISWINWNYSDDFRSGAVWLTGTCSNGPWTTARLKPAGAWIRERILFPADDFPGGGNVAPTVSIASPSNNASFSAPASVTITANAADADGSVVKVEFFSNGSKIGERTAAPWSFSWTNVAAGSYALTARATDNGGATTTSAGVNITVNAPVTRSPYGGTVRSIPGRIEAEHYDVGGQSITFNDLTPGNSGNAFRTDAVDIEGTTDAGGGFNVGWIQAGEWLEYTVNVTTAGSLRLEARVAALSGSRTFHVQMDGQNISGPITVPSTGGWQTWTTVTVNTTNLTTGQKRMRIFMDGGDFNLNHITFSTITSTPNVPPTVSLTSPSNGASFTAPANITISANASDSDGSIAKVDFYNGTTLLYSDATAPYSYVLSGAAAGTYSFRAVAFDNAGASANSATVSVSVTNPDNNNNTTIGINGPSCVRPGVATTFTLNPEPGFTGGTWWTTGDATTVVAAGAKSATITYTTNAIGSVTISMGANFSNAPWYKEYRKTITVSNSCSVTAQRVESPKVVASPQPFNESTNVSVDNGEVIFSARLFDVQGNEVYAAENVGTETVSIGKDLPAGIYILKVVTSERTYTERIVKH